MSQSLSLTMREAMFAQQTGEVPVLLLTIDHASLSKPLRFSSDPTERLAVDPVLRYGTVSRGEEYDFLPMEYVTPEDSEDAPSTMRIAFDNIARAAIPLLRSVSDPPTVTAEIVLASAPDDVEMAWPEFDLVMADYDAEKVSIDLALDALATEPYPADSFTPGGFGGLF